MTLGYKLTNDAKQAFEIIIDGIRFEFQVYWNTTANKWFMDVSDATSGDAIITGEAIVASISYSDRLGLTFSNLWVDVINEYEQPVDPTRYGFEFMQFYAQPKDLTFDSQDGAVPLNVVTHNGLYVIHDGSYVIHTAGL